METDFTPAQARELLMTLVGAVGDTEVKEVLKSAVLAKTALQDTSHSFRLTPDEVIRDLFYKRERDLPMDAGKIHVGPTLGAAGDGADATVEHYSHFAPQPQILTRNYDKLSEEMGSLRAYLKSLTETMQTQMQAVAKTLETLTTKAEDEGEKVEVNVEEEDDETEKSASFKSLRADLLATLMAKAEEEEEEGEGEEEEEMGKALSAAFRVTLAKATLRASKDLTAKSDLSRMAKSNVKAVVATALRKAHWLARSALDDKTVAKAAQEALRATEEYMFLRGIPLTVKAKPMAKKEEEENQKEWPDKDSAKSLEAITKTLMQTQTDVKGLFDMIQRGSKSASAIEVVEPLAKALGNPNFIVEKRRFIEEEAKARRIDSNVEGAALDVLGAMELAKVGSISKDVPAAMLQGASSKVKSLFREVEVGA